MIFTRIKSFSCYPINITMCFVTQVTSCSLIRWLLLTHNAIRSVLLTWFRYVVVVTSLLKRMSGQRTTFSQVLKVQFEDMQTVLDFIKVHLEYLGSTFHKLWIMGIWGALWGHKHFPGLYKSALWGSLLQNRVRPRSITGWIAAWALCGGDEVPRWPIKPKIPPIKPILNSTLIKPILNSTLIKPTPNSTLKILHWSSVLPTMMVGTPAPASLVGTKCRHAPSRTFTQR